MGIKTKSELSDIKNLILEINHKLEKGIINLQTIDNILKNLQCLDQLNKCTSILQSNKNIIDWVTNLQKDVNSIKKERKYNANKS